MRWEFLLVPGWVSCVPWFVLHVSGFLDEFSGFLDVISFRGLSKKIYMLLSGLSVIYDMHSKCYMLHAKCSVLHVTCDNVKCKSFIIYGERGDQELCS